MVELEGVYVVLVVGNEGFCLDMLLQYFVCYDNVNIISVVVDGVDLNGILFIVDFLNISNMLVDIVVFGVNIDFVKLRDNFGDLFVMIIIIKFGIFMVVLVVSVVLVKVYCVGLVEVKIWVFECVIIQEIYFFDIIGGK